VQDIDPDNSLSDTADLQTRLALHRDQPVTCAHCGRIVKRKSRHQKFCSNRCRVSAHRAEAIKIHQCYPSSGAETKATKIASNSNCLHEQFSRSTAHISGPAHVIKIEVLDRHKWHGSVSPDGVPHWIAYLRPRT
jgi:hypothetical protein